LLLRDGFEHPELALIAARFNAALTELGYPACPGNIMLTNPLWRQPLAQFKDTLREWIYGADAEGAMQLAIFIDSTAVAGDVSLLESARDHLDRILGDSDAFLARFASAIDRFGNSASWWHRLTTQRDEEPLDLKKLGTFPIVHGVRALALQQRLRETGTAARLRLLVERQRLDAGLARDVLEALHYLMSVRLTHQLRQKRAGQLPDNTVRTSELGILERDALRDALAVVRRFRGVLQQRFRLDAV
jgi:CBS domain-containing protein